MPLPAKNTKEKRVNKKLVEVSHSDSTDPQWKYMSQNFEYHVNFLKRKKSDIERYLRFLGKKESK